MSNLLNITTVRGDTWHGLNATVTKKISGVFYPIDLTGAEIRMQLKRNASDECYVLEFSSLSTIDNVITITEPLSGKFKVEPEIINITARNYAYDLQVVTADVNIGTITILKGAFTVEQDITT